MPETLVDPRPEADLFQRLVARVASGGDLTAAEAETAFHQVMEGSASPVQMSALLVGLKAKGHRPAEVAGGVRALRRAMVSVAPGKGAPLVDTCGTGGGSVKTFNISTAAALVAAGAGVRIAKHGNRSFTSKSGSADVMEALGVVIQLSPEAMARILDEVGIVFMFAPLLHPAMRHVAPVRRELGVSTIMNLLGPLTNPAGVRRQVVGVSDPELLGLVAKALEELGHERALVVHGSPGMDEISPSGESLLVELDGGVLRERTVTPDALGVERQGIEGLRGGSPEENARLIRGVLDGEVGGAARNAVVLNAAAALWVGGVVDSLPEGVVRSTECLDSGRASEVLDRLVEVSRDRSV